MHCTYTYSIQQVQGQIMSTTPVRDNLTVQFNLWLKPQNSHHWCNFASQKMGINQIGQSECLAYRPGNSGAQQVHFQQTYMGDRPGQNWDLRILNPGKIINLRNIFRNLQHFILMEPNFVLDHK